MPDYLSYHERHDQRLINQPLQRKSKVYYTEAALYKDQWKASETQKNIQALKARKTHELTQLDRRSASVINLPDIIVPLPLLGGSSKSGILSGGLQVVFQQKYISDRRFIESTKITLLNTWNKGLKSKWSQGLLKCEPELPLFKNINLKFSSKIDIQMDISNLKLQPLASFDVSIEAPLFAILPMHHEAMRHCKIVGKVSLSSPIISLKGLSALVSSLEKLYDSRLNEINELQNKIDGLINEKGRIDIKLKSAKSKSSRQQLEKISNQLRYEIQRFSERNNQLRGRLKHFVTKFTADARRIIQKKLLQFGVKLGATTAGRIASKTITKVLAKWPPIIGQISLAIDIYDIGVFLWENRSWLKSVYSKSKAWIHELLTEITFQLEDFYYYSEEIIRTIINQVFLTVRLTDER